MTKRLQLAFFYEDLAKMVDTSSLIELIAPVPEFESQIVQIIEDIGQSGYLLFMYGVSGSGKSTFLSSLQWRKHIPISEIINVDASACSDPHVSGTKLRNLFHRLSGIGNKLLARRQNDTDYRICVIIDYLESLQDEENANIVSFFRDLNGLLRRVPMLLVWPVTNEAEVQFMYESASSFSSVMFHRRIPIMKFAGPPLDSYASIAQKTISILNDGQSYHDFQLNESDFSLAFNLLNRKPPIQRTIREYLQTIRDIWEEKTDYVAQVKQRIPGETEVWFVVCYPEAERVVAQFAKRLPDSIEDNWNANYSKLAEYVTGQKIAEWPTTPLNRLALAITGVLKTKIMFMPTNTLVTCILSYADEAGLPLPREPFAQMEVPSHWFTKSRAGLTLKKTPLYRQLVGESGSKGRGGMAADALEKARKPFEYINSVISKKEGIAGSDKPFNKTIAYALRDALRSHSNVQLDIAPEKPHPWLSVIPDILITTPEQKFICVEFHYTINPQPNRLATYCLDKLDKYMRQVEQNERQERLL